MTPVSGLDLRAYMTVTSVVNSRVASWNSSWTGASAGAFNAFNGFSGFSGSKNTALWGGGTAYLSPGFMVSSRLCRLFVAGSMAAGARQIFSTYELTSLKAISMRGRITQFSLSTIGAWELAHWSSYLT